LTIWSRPGADKSEREIELEHTFPKKVNKDSQGNPIVDVAIKEFKLDQRHPGDLLLIDTVQVGARSVGIKPGSNDKTVKFTIRCRYTLKNPAADYTGEVTALIIADVAP